MEIVPGITSFTGCAATAGISLGEKDEIIVIVPKVDERLERILEYGDTFVVMKTSRHSDTLEKIVHQIQGIKMLFLCRTVVWRMK